MSLGVPRVGVGGVTGVMDELGTAPDGLSVYICQCTFVSVHLLAWTTMKLVVEELQYVSICVMFQIGEIKAFPFCMHSSKDLN